MRRRERGARRPEAGEAGRLDRRRAEFVRDWLTARGVRPERIWVGGRGGLKPVVAADGEAPENRRVDFFLTRQGALCEAKFRAGVWLWLLQHCVRAPHAADSANCAEALRLLR